MSWESVRGHDVVVKAFARAVQRGRLAHAYLFVGPTGIGKKLFARELAKVLLCEKRGEAFAACQTCTSCVQVEAGTHADFVFAGMPEGKQEWPIDLMRDVLHNFTIKTSRGKGKVVVLDFWAPWCGPCKHEMPILDKLAKKLGPDVIVLGVLVDPDLDGARAVLSRLQIGYPQVDDERRAASRAFSVSVLPTLVVIDRTGTVRTYRTGFSPEEDLEAAIKRALAS